MTRTAARLLSLVLVPALAVACAPQELAPPEHAPDDHDAPLESYGPEQLGAMDQDGDWVPLPPLKGVAGATRVALMITLESAGEPPVMEARGTLADGTTTAWLPLETPWAEAELAVLRVDFDAEIEAPELRIAADGFERVDQLSWTAVHPSLEDGDVDDGVSLQSEGTAQQGLSSTLTNLGVRSRAAWGARAPNCSSTENNKHRMAIHHTAGAAGTSDASIRQIQAFHINGRGWCDIGYHFLVGTNGTIWEGRPVNRLGGHVGGNNSGNIGISWVGCFQPGACSGISSPSSPTNTSIAKGAALVQTLSNMFGIPRNSDRIRGHREHSGQTTSCPGNNLLARIGELRAGAAAPAVTFCTGKDGSWCDGNDRVVCDNGTQASRSSCEHGCQSMPSGTPDQCINPFPPSCFNDMGGTWAEDSICALKDLGITQGCGGGAYCPSQDVTRAAMVVFLDRLHQLVNGQAAPVVATPFSDIGGHWAATSIARMYGLGITQGTSDTQFSPGQSVSRAQIATFLSRLYEVIEGAPAPRVSTPFVDVEGHWAEADIERMYALGVTHGVDATHYGPSDEVNRAQMAVFLMRIFNVLTASCFEDTRLHWAEDDICALADLGLTHGCGADAFCPADDVTRASMAVFLDRLYTAVSGEQAPLVETPFVDVSGHWAEQSIQRVYGLGITQGTDATHYSPEQTVTRAHMAVFLSRLYAELEGSPAPAVATPFVDIADHWAKSDIERVYGLGITQGVDDTHFAPARQVTRAQMAAFLMRTYGVVAD